MMSTSAVLVLVLSSCLSIGQCQLESDETTRQMIGRSCFSNNDCPPQALCRKLAPSCNYGACLCPQLHHWDPVKGACRKSASLGESCGEDQACKGDYTICGSSGVCECDSRQGTRPDYRGRNCIRNFSIQRLGEPCFDSTQCYSRTMQCKYNQCICQNGTIPLNRYECARRNIDDPCNNDGECSYVMNAECNENSGRCQCKNGFQKFEYLITIADDWTQSNVDDPNNVIYGCAESRVVALSSGQTCDYFPYYVAANYNGPKFCKESLFCAQCNVTSLTCSEKPTWDQSIGKVTSTTTIHPSTTTTRAKSKRPQVQSSAPALYFSFHILLAFSFILAIF